MKILRFAKLTLLRITKGSIVYYVVPPLLVYLTLLAILAGAEAEISLTIIAIFLLAPVAPLSLYWSLPSILDMSLLRTGMEAFGSFLYRSSILSVAEGWLVVVATEANFYYKRHFYYVTPLGSVKMLDEGVVLKSWLQDREPPGKLLEASDTVPPDAVRLMVERQHPEMAVVWDG